MITAVFACAADAVAAVTVSGHAGYAPAGEDIVCASVSSAVQLTANALTEILGTRAQVKVSENSVKIVPAQGDSRSQDFLRALQLHLELLAEDYPGTVKVTISEV